MPPEAVRERSRALEIITKRESMRIRLGPFANEFVASLFKDGSAKQIKTAIQVITDIILRDKIGRAPDEMIQKVPGPRGFLVTRDPFRDSRMLKLGMAGWKEPANIFETLELASVRLRETSFQQPTPEVILSVSGLKSVA